MIDYNSLADVYDSKYTGELCEKENEAIAGLFKKFVKNGADVLDLGCGTGFALDMLGKAGVSVGLYNGIDMSAEMLKKAAKKNYGGVAKGNIFTQLPVERLADANIDRKDVVMSIFSIPYIGANLEGVAENTMKDDGIFIAVYYDMPYLNPASVYAGKKEEYMQTVRPEVRKVIKSLSSAFETVYDAPLTEEQTYRVKVFRKKGRE